MKHCASAGSLGSRIGPARGPTMANFFISYNRADRSWAEWIAWHLEEAGYTTALQAWDFPAGSNFVHQMQNAISDAERTIAVLSPDYLTSRFTQPEWEAAFAQDPTGEKGLLVPVRVRQCEPKGLLPQIVYIDLLGFLEETAARDALLARVGREGGKPMRGKPTKKPVFPLATSTATGKPRFPGALPPKWNISYSRNPNFTGRVQLLNSLRTKLLSGQPAAPIQVVTGLGGVGKTQIAVEYAYRFASDYELVWLLRAEELTKLTIDYTALASKLELREKDASEQLNAEERASAIVGSVRDWLSQNGGWLLIFDNAPGPTDVRDYLPQGATGHVIVTSRNANWQGMSALPVESMKPEESVNFLLSRTKKDRKDNEEAASRLAEALGSLPLALEQAGAYIEETGCSIEAYLDLFRIYSKKLMTHEAGSNYQETVATTWKVSFEQVKKSSAEAENLLSLCAFLAPDEIPLPVLISKGSRHLPDSLAMAIRDDTGFLSLLASLRRYSLVKVSEDLFVSVHRLVQAVGRDRLSEGDMKKWAGIAVLLLNEAFQFDRNKPQTWPACSTLLPHALAATEHAKELQVAMKPTGELVTALSKYSVGRAEFATVKAAFKQALWMDEHIHDPDHPTVAQDATNLGFLLKNKGDLQDARPYFERALKINLQAYGADDPRVATSRNNLGIILKDLGCLKQAQREFKRALKINENKYGAEHLEVVVILNNLGYLLKDQGDLDGAQMYFERALQIKEAEQGGDRRGVATTLNNLGIIRAAKDDLDPAQTYFKRALEENEKFYGANHPEVATTLNNLGYLMKKKSDVERARRYFRRALRIYEAVYGRDHPNVATTRENLSSLKKQKLIPKARRPGGHSSHAPRLG
jgi:tetratricopeptide (TPR) repeat protein